MTPQLEGYNPGLIRGSILSVHYGLSYASKQLIAGTYLLIQINLLLKCLLSRAVILNRGVVKNSRGAANF